MDCSQKINQSKTKEEIKDIHIYKCAGCGELFESAGFAERCPKCGCRVLIHKKGEQRRAKGCCCTGGCAGCGGCSH
ncbi:MAG: hypothetical protein RR091_05090 [Cloacibacillus sp.]